MLTVIELTKEDAKLFIEFQKHYVPVAHLLGYMDTLGLSDLKNMSIVMDIDSDGKVAHTSFTRHFR
ncbi:MAG: hypothetical protein NTW30_04985 [Candidatus Aenigmarchaeota archaeon]|nr:hypothetical protein [Candidatus Aenigmarchaeota archaeon]